MYQISSFLIAAFIKLYGMELFHYVATLKTKPQKMLDVIGTWKALASLSV